MKNKDPLYLISNNEIQELVKQTLHNLNNIFAKEKSILNLLEKESLHLK